MNRKKYKVSFYGDVEIEAETEEEAEQELYERLDGLVDNHTAQRIEELECAECEGTGEVEEGEHDNITTRKCLCQDDE